VLAESANARSLANRPALDFTGTVTTVGTGEDTAFARSVAARYGASTALAEVLADIRAQGFTCTEDISYCTRNVMDGLCFNAWIIDIASDESVSGRRMHQCMGAQEEDE
jgi:hypothetical protein